MYSSLMSTFLLGGLRSATVALKAPVPFLPGSKPQQSLHGILLWWDAKESIRGAELRLNAVPGLIGPVADDTMFGRAVAEDEA